MLASVTLALGAYLRRKGEETEGLELRAMIPVSVRVDAERGALGNRVAAMYAPLPVGLTDPEEVFAAVHTAMGHLKQSGQAVGAQRLTEIADFAPTTIMTQAARLQARQRLFNLVVTNVPGPQVELYLLGRPLLGLYPVVPLAQRQALGIAIMSYHGRLGFGLLGDYDAMPDLEDLASRPRARGRRAVGRDEGEGEGPRPPSGAGAQAVTDHAGGDLIRRVLVGLGLFAVAVAGVVALIAFFNAHDSATTSGDGAAGAGPARHDLVVGAAARRQRVLEYSNRADAAPLRAIARTEAGTDRPDSSLVAAGQAVIVDRVGERRRRRRARLPPHAARAERQGSGRRGLRQRLPRAGRAVRIALSQMNAVVGDIAGNERRIREGIAAAREGGARLVLFPELAVSGYPPEDLLLKEHFLADVRAAVRAARAPRPTASWRSSGSPSAPTTSTTRPRCSPTASCGASTARSTCPTTACSTRCATSSPARARRRRRGRRREGRADDLRGHLGARRARGATRRSPARR